MSDELKRHHETMAELNPVGLNKRFNDARSEKRRELLQVGATTFLRTGEAESQHAPPSYGKEWDRTYNPRPYPEAVPDQEAYEGTGIGLLYGFGGEEHAWQLAGWTLVRTGAEVRTRRHK